MSPLSSEEGGKCAEMECQEDAVRQVNDSAWVCEIHAKVFEELLEVFGK